MLMKQEKILEYVDSLPFHVIRAAWVARCRTENDRIYKLESTLISDGMERVDAAGQITSDGREVIHIRGRAYALRPDIHAERMAQRFEAEKIRKEKQKAKEPEVKSVSGTESSSSFTCTKCGDMLQHTTICPACEAGKIGYRHKYQCMCGATEFISKDKL